MLSSFELPRRRVLTASAWAAPVVVLSATSPAYAVSATQSVAIAVWHPVLHPGEVSAVEVTVRDERGRGVAGAAVALSVSGASAFLERSTGVTDAWGTFSTILRVRDLQSSAAGLVTASTGGSSSSASFTVRKTAVIEHDADGRSTRVLALPHGSQDESAAAENRGMPHSDLQPTGRYVRSGEVLTVEVDGSPSWWLELNIGTRGPMQVFGADGSEGMASTVLTGGTNTITADRSGIVFVTNHSEWSAVPLVISGGHPQPVWVKGASTKDDFDAQMRSFSDAPIVTHVGDRIFADIQRSVIDAPDVSTVYDPDLVTSRLDLAREHTDAIYGLSYDAVGVARKHGGRVYVSGPDSGGAYAFATYQWLSLHVSSGASRALARSTDWWTMWHEIGHTYQTPQYTWSGLGEVTVNISSLAAEKRTTGGNMLDDSPGLQQRISRYFADPVDKRHFENLTDEGPFYPLFLFDQLRRSFGDDFYAALSQKYRVRRALGRPSEGSDRQKIDSFALLTSEVADRDLGPFFRAWGVTVSEEVLAVMAQHPSLQHEFWTAITTADAPLERVVPYNPPTGTLWTPTDAVYLGDTAGSTAEVSDLGSVRGSRSAVVARGTLAVQVGSGTGRVYAVLESEEGTQEVLQRPVSVTAVSALEFVGFYDVMIGSIGISADGSHIVATSTGNQAHQIYFAGQVYYEVELRDAAGVTRTTVSVKGEDTAQAVADALHGVPCGEGDELVIRAAEPTRVRVYQDSNRVGTLTSNPTTVRISGGRFVL